MAALALLLGLTGSATAGPMSPLVLDFAGGEVVSSTAVAPAGLIGWQFTVTTPITVVGLGWWDDGSVPLTSDTPVGLWTAGGTALVQTTVTNALSTPIPSSSGEGRWLFTPIFPIQLAPGAYVLGGVAFSGVFDFRESASAITIPGVTFDMARLEPGAGLLEFPSVSQPLDDAGLFGPNLEVAAAVPEPNSLTLLAIGAAAVAVWRRRRESGFRS